MDIAQDIKEAISRQLPAEIGKVLAQRLEEVNDLERRNIALDKMAKEQAETLTRYRKMDRNEEAIEKLSAISKAKADDLDKRERALEIREAVSKAVAEAEQRAAAGYREVVLAVFANSRFKYERTTAEQIPLVVPAGNGGGGYIQNGTKSESLRIEGEGAPPAGAIP